MILFFFLTESFNVSYENIQSLSSNEKVLFINKFSSCPALLARSESGFKLNHKHNLDDTQITRIFYAEDWNGEFTRRNWLIYKHDNFFCMLCLCFGLNLSLKSVSINQFINGIDYEDPFHRFIQKIRRHEDLQYHIASEKQYLEYIKYNKCDNTDAGDNRKSRIVVEIVIKIIIFLATHNKLYNTLSLFL